MVFVTSVAELQEVTDKVGLNPNVVAIFLPTHFEGLLLSEVYYDCSWN